MTAKGWNLPSPSKPDALGRNGDKGWIPASLQSAANRAKLPIVDLAAEALGPPTSPDIPSQFCTGIAHQKTAAIPMPCAWYEDRDLCTMTKGAQRSDGAKMEQSKLEALRFLR